MKSFALREALSHSYVKDIIWFLRNFCIVGEVVWWTVDGTYYSALSSPIVCLCRQDLLDVGRWRGDWCVFLFQGMGLWKCPIFAIGQSAFFFFLTSSPLASAPKLPGAPGGVTTQVRYLRDRGLYQLLRIWHFSSLFFQSFFSVDGPFYWDFSVLLATPRGQGRGRTVIPGFAVRYISIMLPSQTRHLMCQSQMVVLPSPLPLFIHMICGGGLRALYDRRRVTKRGQLLSPLPCSIFLFWFQVASHSTTGTEAR